MDTSKLLERSDFRRAEFPAEWLTLHIETSITERLADKAVREVAERFLTLEEVRGGIEAGDIAILELPAEGELEAEVVHVNVGLGFRGEEWENTLRGRRAGERVTMSQEDGGRVGTIRSAVRRNVPAPTDEMVGSLKIRNVDTVKSYRQYVEDSYIGQEVEGRARRITNHVMEELVRTSSFGDLAQEIRDVVAHIKAGVSLTAARAGVTYEEVIATMVPRQYDTPEKIEAFLPVHVEGLVKTALLGLSHVEEDGMPFNRENYKKKFERRVAEGEKREELEVTYSFEDYQRSTALNYLHDKVKKHFKAQIQVEKRQTAEIQHTRIGEIDHMNNQHIVYKTQGVCASEISFDVVEGYIHNIQFKGGCQGNSRGVAAGMEGLKLIEVVRRCKGIDCHGSTSCPDQLARAVEQVIASAE